MVGWLQNNIIVPITAGIITLIIALLEKKFLKEDDNLRELREQQLSSTYGPLKMLLIKYEKNRMDRQELINSIKEIWDNYYLFLDNSLNKSNCLGAHYSNINSGFPINAFFIASTSFFQCFLAVPI